MKTKEEFKKSLKLNEKCNYDFECLYTCYLLGYADGTNDERECLKEILKSFNFPYIPSNPSFPSSYPSPIVTWDKVTCLNKNGEN